MAERDPCTAYADEPHIEGGVHHPYTAYNQGFDACEAGAPTYRNPYHNSAREWWWWNEGWHDCNQDDRPEPLRIPPRRRLAASVPLTPNRTEEDTKP